MNANPIQKICVPFELHYELYLCQKHISLPFLLVSMHCLPSILLYNNAFSQFLLSRPCALPALVQYTPLSIYVHITQMKLARHKDVVAIVIWMHYVGVLVYSHRLCLLVCLPACMRACSLEMRQFGVLNFMHISVVQSVLLFGVTKETHLWVQILWMWT